MPDDSVAGAGEHGVFVQREQRVNRVRVTCGRTNQHFT